MANLLEKANILITPTAYSDGKIHSAKPIQSLSAEKVVNGDFENGSTGWTKDSNWTISGGKANLIGNTTDALTSTDLVLDASKTYKISYNISNYVSGGLAFVIGNISIPSTNGFHQFNYTGQTNFSIKRFGGDSQLSIDNISIKEVIDADLNFTRGSAATRVNAQCLVENSQGNSIPRINYKDFQYEDSLGSEEVVNGDFATDSDWILENGAIINNGSVNIIGAGSRFKQDVLTVGKTYKLDYEVISTNGASFRFQDGVTAFVDINQTVGIHTYYFEATGVRTQFQAVGDINARIDNVSVKEVTKVVTPNSGVGSWLIEPQSTNLLEYSESFDNSYWVKSGATVTSGFSAPSVDSPLGAFKLVEGTSNGQHKLQKANLTVSATSNTVSYFIKKAERNKVLVEFGGGGGGTAGFDLSLGAIISESGVTAKIELISSDWYRCSVTFTTTSTSVYTSVYTLNDSNSNSYQGDGTSGVYIFASQTEQQSFATSYIPTNGSVQTRLAETASRSGLGDLIDSTQGVFYAEISALSNDGVSRRLSISDGTSSNRVFIGFGSTINTFQFVVQSSGSIALNQLISVSDTTKYAKVAISYKLNDVSIWINGSKVGTDTVATMPSSLNSLALNQGNGTENFNGNIKAVAVYPILTDQELECLTTR